MFYFIGAPKFILWLALSALVNFPIVPLFVNVANLSVPYVLQKKWIVTGFCCTFHLNLSKSYSLIKIINPHCLFFPHGMTSVTLWGLGVAWTKNSHTHTLCSLICLTTLLGSLIVIKKLTGDVLSHKKQFPSWTLNY